MTAAVAPYRAGTIKRERRTSARVEQLDRQILDVLAEDHPQSVRHVFYRMTNPRLPEPVEKSERGYRHVQDRIVKLRRARRLPYGWITDATRRGHFVDTFRGPANFLRRMKAFYRADLWGDADVYVEVWTESRSIAGVVEDLCSELAVSLYPAGGFASLSLVHGAAETMLDYANNRPSIVFYIGDYDPAGVLIDVAIERELRQHLPQMFELHFERIAITPEQIASHDLPTKPRKDTDRRARHIAETVEAEAMPAHILRNLLRNRVESLLPERALEVALAEEESAKAYFDQLADLTAREYHP